MDRDGFYVTEREPRIFVERFVPGEGEPQATVLCLPGIGNYGWYFTPLARYLNARGISVHAVDYRGTGLSRGTRWDVPSLEVWCGDVAAALGALPSRAPAFLLGHSIGAALAIQAIVPLQSKVVGLVVVAPAMSVDSKPIPWVNYLLFPIASVLSSRPMLRIPIPTCEEMVGNHADKELAQALQVEPYRLAHMTSRCGMTINTIRTREAARSAAIRTTLPVAVVCGENDAALDGAIQYHDALGSADKTLIVLPRQHHHLLRSPQQTEVFREIAAWLELHIHG